MLSSGHNEINWRQSNQKTVLSYSSQACGSLSVLLRQSTARPLREREGERQREEEWERGRAKGRALASHSTYTVLDWEMCTFMWFLLEHQGHQVRFDVPEHTGHMGCSGNNNLCYFWYVTS